MLKSTLASRVLLTLIFFLWGCMVLSGAVTADGLEAWVELEVNVISTPGEYAPDELIVPHYWQGQYRQSGAVTVHGPGGLAMPTPLSITDKTAWGFHTCQDDQSFLIGQYWFDLDVELMKRGWLEIKHIDPDTVQLSYVWPQMKQEVQECPRRNCYNSSYALLPHYGAPTDPVPIRQVSAEELRAAANAEVAPLALSLTDTYQDYVLLVQGWIGQELMLASLTDDELPLAPIPVDADERDIHEHPCWGTEIREGIDTAEAEVVRQETAAALEALGALIGPEHVIVHYDARWRPGRDWDHLRFTVMLGAEDNQPVHTLACIGQVGSVEPWPSHTVLGADKVLTGFIQQENSETKVTMSLVRIVENELLGEAEVAVSGWSRQSLAQAIGEAAAETLAQVVFR